MSSAYRDIPWGANVTCHFCRRAAVMEQTGDIHADRKAFFSGATRWRLLFGRPWCGCAGGTML